MARSLPTRSPDGKTYTFRIRPGFRFSPPSNEPVTAQTFKLAIERGLKLPAALWGRADDILGAKALAAGTATHVAGVVANGDRLTFRLTAPDPVFVSLLAEPLFCAVPTDTPLAPEGVGTLPSAGPYYVASYTPDQQIVLKRNPNYHGQRPHGLKEIDISIGVPRIRASARSRQEGPTTPSTTASCPASTRDSPGAMAPRPAPRASEGSATSSTQHSPSTI